VEAVAEPLNLKTDFALELILSFKITIKSIAKIEEKIIKNSRMTVLRLHCKACMIGVAFSVLGNWIIVRIRMTVRPSLQLLAELRD
jgi:hypothetical protein